MRRGLEAVWYWFEAIPIQAVGLIEARSFITKFDKWLGPKLFSVRRIISCFILNSIFVAIFYVLVEGNRYRLGFAIRPPFEGAHLTTGWPYDAILGAVSLSFTRFLIRSSLSIYGHLKLSTLYLSLTILFTFFVTLMLSDCLSIFAFISSAIMATAARGHWGSFIHGAIRIDGEDYHWASGFGILFLTIYLEYHKIINILQNYFLHLSWSQVFYLPFSVPEYYVHLASYDDETSFAGLGEYYTRFTSLMFSYIRGVFAIAFFFLWGVIIPLHRVVSRILLRLIETKERGPLSVLVFLLAGLIKAVELLHHQMPTP